MKRIDLRGTRLGEGGLSVEDVELRACSGLVTSSCEAQGFVRLFLNFLLGSQNFAGFNKIGVSLAHLLFNLPADVLQVEVGFFLVRLRLDHLPAGEKAIENV